jgi:hypothetical protein
MDKSTYTGLTHIKDNMIDNFYILKKQAEKLNLDFMIGRELNDLLVEIRTLESYLEGFKPLKTKKIKTWWGKCT